ncbi:hypothetical protein CRYUN_Cryun22dG0098200 [Craigia yunnanensis]
MWVMIAAFGVLVGAVIWIIEGQDEDGPNFLEALFFVHRRPLHNNAARILKVFPKGSPLASDISASILELEESGELQLMEEEMSYFSDCSRKLFEDASIQPIEPSSFRGFFVLFGGTSAIALLITLIKLLNRHWEGHIQKMLIGREFWQLLMLMQRMLMARELFIII